MGISKSYNKICYGYKHDSEGNLCIKESEAKNVRFIYNCYLDGHSIISILKELKKESIPSPTGKDTWSKKTVENILTNIKYTGTVIILVDDIQYKIVDHHPAIISSDAFDAVQIERDLRSNITTDSNGISSRKNSKYSSIRTIRETHDYEKDRLRLLNKLEEYKLQDIKAERLGILSHTTK